MLAPLKKSMHAAEKQVEKLAGEVARLDAALADPELYAKDPAKARQLTLERGQTAKLLAAAEESWLAATDAYETAAADA
jgi:ATP-binding cassette subfamily F protein 3